MKVLVFGQKWSYSGKVAVIGQMWLYLVKLVGIWARMGVFGQKLL